MSNELLEIEMARCEQLEEENKRLKEALTDIFNHTIHPFIGEKWMGYLHYIANEALKAGRLPKI